MEKHPPLFILISHYQTTTGGDLSILFPLHAGFEPSLPCWLSAGWKGYYIMWYYMHMSSIESLHSHASPATDISPNWFSHICMYSIATCSIFVNCYCCILLQSGSTIRCQWCSLAFRRPNDCKGFEPGYFTTNGTTVRHAIHCSIPFPLKHPYPVQTTAKNDTIFITTTPDFISLPKYHFTHKKYISWHKSAQKKKARQQHCT